MNNVNIKYNDDKKPYIACAKCDEVVTPYEKLSHYQLESIAGKQPPMLPHLCKACIADYYKTKK
jgi:hypothetical protein